MFCVNIYIVDKQVSQYMKILNVHPVNSLDMDGRLNIAEKIEKDTTDNNDWSTD